MSNVRFIHLVTKARNGRTDTGHTVAYRFNDAKQVVEVAVSKCHTRDNYNHKIGRLVAAGRLDRIEPVEIEYKHFPDGIPTSASLAAMLGTDAGQRLFRDALDYYSNLRLAAQ